MTNIYAISYRDKKNKENKPVMQPHVLLIQACDEQTAWIVAKEKTKEMDGDLRTMKWVGTTIPIFQKTNNPSYTSCYHCIDGSIDDGAHV